MLTDMRKANVACIVPGGASVVVGLLLSDPGFSAAASAAGAGIIIGDGIHELGRLLG
jgi:hypothetical protein